MDTSTGVSGGTPSKTEMMAKVELSHDDSEVTISSGVRQPDDDENNNRNNDNNNHDSTISNDDGERRHDYGEEDSGGGGPETNGDKHTTLDYRIVCEASSAENHENIKEENNVENNERKVDRNPESLEIPLSESSVVRDVTQLEMDIKSDEAPDTETTFVSQTLNDDHDPDARHADPNSQQQQLHNDHHLHQHNNNRNDNPTETEDDEGGADGE